MEWKVQKPNHVPLEIWYFNFSRETMHYSIHCVKVICYPFGTTYVFILHIIYKNKFWITEPNINKTNNTFEEK